MLFYCQLDKLPYLCTEVFDKFPIFYFLQMKLFLTSIFIFASALIAKAQSQEVTGSSALDDDSIQSSHVLDDVTVKAPTRGRVLSRVTNTEQIGQAELVRAACCRGLVPLVFD